MAHSHDSSPHGDDVNGDTAVMTAPPQLKKPPLFAVVLLNDDYTPMEFVIDILQHYFKLTFEQATDVMLNVHYKGKGVAGIYPRAIAETKMRLVNQFATDNGHPLQCQLESQ